MIAVITGDIIASRKILNQDEWLVPLKTLFSEWGKRPGDWDLERGDFFQLEVKNPEDALKRALEIKALIRKVVPLDVRMAIGIGVKTYSGEAISESNGEAFINSGEKFDMLDKENITIGMRLGIKQNSVSGRWNRANVNEILEVERMYRKKIKALLG